MWWQLLQHYAVGLEKKKRLYLIRTVEKLNVCSGGNFLMKGSNSLDSLFADSQKSLLEGTACQLYRAMAHGKTKHGKKKLTVLRKCQSSQIKRLQTKISLLTLNGKGS